MITGTHGYAEGDVIGRFAVPDEWSSLGSVYFLAMARINY